MECQSIDRTWPRSCAGLGARAGEWGAPSPARRAASVARDRFLRGPGFLPGRPGGGVARTDRRRWDRSGWKILQRQRWNS